MSNLRLFDADDYTEGDSRTGIIHQCSVCKRRGRWREGWQWYGSLRDIDDGQVVKVCPDCERPSNEDAKRMLKAISKAGG